MANPQTQTSIYLTVNNPSCQTNDKDTTPPTSPAPQMTTKKDASTSYSSTTNVTIQVVYAPRPDDDDDDDNDSTDTTTTSAALEFSKRTVEYFLRRRRLQLSTTTNSNRNIFISSSSSSLSQHGIIVDVIPPLHIKDYYGTKLQEQEQQETTETCCSPNNCVSTVGSDAGARSTNSKSMTTIIVFIVSCGLDGSVHRSVRKVSKLFRTNADGNNSTNNSTTNIKHRSGHAAAAAAAVALLGHAVCKTSSEQASDEIFMAGRRFVKSLTIQAQKQQHQQHPQPQQHHHPERDMNIIVPTLETQVELVDPDAEFDPWLETLWNQICSSFHVHPLATPTTVAKQSTLQK